MATVKRALLDRYSDGIKAVSERAQKAMDARLRSMDYSDMTQAIDRIVADMNTVCGAAAEASAEMGAVFYDGISQLQTGEGYEAAAYSDHLDEGTEKAVRGIVQEGVDGNLEGMIGQLLARVDYETKRAAGNTVIQNARRDRRSPRYARVPSGVETCPFCIMLASRGPIYHTAESAGFNNHYHPNCDCRIVPMFDVQVIPTMRDGKLTGGYIARASSIQGYDPDALYSQYMGMVLEGKKWAAKDGWARARLRSGSANPGNMSVKNRTQYFNASVDDSLRQLRGAQDYEQFMARAQNVAGVWDAMRERIGTTQDARKRKAAMESWERAWRRLNIEAGAVRETFL